MYSVKKHRLQKTNYTNVAIQKQISHYNFKQLYVVFCVHRKSETYYQAMEYQRVQWLLTICSQLKKQISCPIRDVLGCCPLIRIDQNQCWPGNCHPYIMKHACSKFALHVRHCNSSQGLYVTGDVMVNKTNVLLILFLLEITLPYRLT